VALHAVVSTQAVSNEQSTAGGQLSGCTNTHLLNITTGDVLWMKEPVDSSQQWSEQVGQVPEWRVGL
jgi:hypothetical protein